ncbi:MAG TPA: AbrB/MazE/SpoVT family DNA-binding domain-containing protein [Verrucomicrobiae bacterium]|nr:AbrB/MazE/SpoVT family DNA-binding domain-containing protein [Verrucomicrobiae bacterium]
MTKVININGRGTLTLPKQMRDKLGLKDAGQVVAEETAQGILIRAGVTFPIEMYTDKRVAEFDRVNEKALRRYRLKAKR